MEPSADERFVVAAWRFVRGYGAQVSTTVSATLLALASIDNFDAYRDALLWTGLSLGAVGIVWMVFTRPTYARLLQERNDEQSSARERSELLQHSLKVMLKRLAEDLSLDTVDHRFSVYCHRDKHFVMLARHSEQAQYDQNGRVVYPESRDVISDAWNKGQGGVYNLPADKKKRVEQLVSKQGMTEEAASNLTMPSRSLVGIRLDDMKGHVGVLIAESTLPGGVSPTTIDALTSSASATAIQSVMTSARDHFPAMIGHVLPSAALRPRAPQRWAIRLFKLERFLTPETTLTKN